MTNAGKIPGTLGIFLVTLLSPGLLWAADMQPLDLTVSAVGFGSISIFVVMSARVMSEEFTRLRKSRTVIIAASFYLSLVLPGFSSCMTGIEDDRFSFSHL